MALVLKDNVELTVADTEVDAYLQRGYNLINEKGEVIKAATGGRNVTLAEYNALQEQLVKRDEEIKALRKEVAALKKAEK